MHVRLFLGVPLPEALSGPLLGVCEAIRTTDRAWRDARWVSESNLHLTLAFLGDVAETDVPKLCGAFSMVGCAHQKFDLPFDAIRAVPSRRRCRMIWAAFLDPEGRCEALARDLADAARPACAVVDERSFRAHVTLCRARHTQAIRSEALDEAAGSLTSGPSSVSVPSFTLFQSRLTPSGAVYTERGSWALERE